MFYEKSIPLAISNTKTQPMSGMTGLKIRTRNVIGNSRKVNSVANANKRVVYKTEASVEFAKMEMIESGPFLFKDRVVKTEMLITYRHYWRC